MTDDESEFLFTETNGWHSAQKDESSAFYLNTQGIDASYLSGDVEFRKIYESKPFATTLVNLEELNIGRYEQVEDANGNKYNYNNPNLVDLNTKGLVFGCCKKLNIAGLTNLNGVVDLTVFPVLEVLEARNDNRVEEFIFPSTDNLKTVNLPANLTKITLTNKLNIKEINVQSMNEIREVSISGSNNYGAATFGIDEIYNLINS